MNWKFAACSLFAVLAAAAAAPKDSLEEILNRMDQASGGFQGMQAKVNHISHTAVIDDNSEESGTVMMKKLRPNELQGRIDFVQPDPRTVTFQQRKVQIYKPKIKTVEVYDLGDKGEQLDRFLMIGFGTSGTELAKEYDMRVAGEDTVAGKSAVKVEMLPKSQQVKNVVTKMELWIPTQGDPYPIQEKIYEKYPGDYVLVKYSDLKINPSISADALKLKLPSGVKTVYPQK
jgi:outer membrane lipoprotein-sorting protein